MKRNYGWLPDIPDKRDRMFKSFMKKPSLPSKVDFGQRHKRVYNQDILGSCVGNAVALGFDFARTKEGVAPFRPSRLFPYYNARKEIGMTAVDSGCFIRDAIKTMAKVGICKERTWPYNVQDFAKQPSVVAYGSARHHLLKEYLRLDNEILYDLKACLAQGYAFVYGFSVYESFEEEETETTGIVQVPGGMETFYGGHAVLCHGYDDRNKWFISRNSWGESWGDGGTFYIPYKYLTDRNLADDFWTIRLI